MHLETECLFLEVKSIYILHLKNLFQGILHHFTGTEEPLPLPLFQKLERYFKYKTLLMVTKRHLSYKQFTDMVITEIENTGENDFFQPQLKWVETRFALMPGTELTLVTSPCCHECSAVEQLHQHLLPKHQLTHTETNIQPFNSVHILLKTSNRHFSNVLV